MRPLTYLLVFLMAPFMASAEAISTMHSDVRALGMGDAYTALASDSSALFYNPAGLARVSGINWKIFSIRAGASGWEAYQKIRDVQGGEGGEEYAEAIEELYGEHVWTGVGGESAFTIPMLGFAVYNHGDAQISVDNPVSPQIYTNVINDYGYVLGFGIPFTPFLHMGANLKYVKRMGARVPWGASFLADLNPEAIYDNMTKWGKGYGADVGVNLRLPTPILSATVSAVWKNVGGMTFRSDDPDADIPSEENDLTLGAAVLFDTPFLSIGPAVDIRYLNRADLQLTRKVNMGVEIDLPLIDIRGGFHEGYYTAGVGVDIGLFRFDVATYGVELGDYPGQIEDRRYVLELTMELGIGGFTASSLSGGDKASGGGGGRSSSSKSIWGTGRLKQRR